MVRLSRTTEKSLQRSVVWLLLLAFVSLSTMADALHFCPGSEHDSAVGGSCQHCAFHGQNPFGHASDAEPTAPTADADSDCAICRFLAQHQAATSFDSSLPFCEMVSPLLLTSAVAPECRLERTSQARAPPVLG
ncbi:MAG: hypothetical protein KDA87_21430 [Planctomycetales bacterium]|nr:hypothetical protein [Planctomycetales bacterium]